jgi:hypothetical protein
VLRRLDADDVGGVQRVDRVDVLVLLAELDQLLPTSSVLAMVILPV